ncbi:MAG: asparagine synthase C-terminal domain-containing protein [Nitrosopumilaceae archaeon]
MTKNQELLDNLQNSIKQTVPQKKIGVAFSGGVDSTLVAKLCTNLGYDVTLLTVGFTESHDILFAKEVNEHLKLSHKILEIELESFDNIASKINNKIKTDNLSWNENCIAFYYVSKLAQSLGLNTVVTANGIDELFCGYNSYRDIIEEDPDKVIESMNSKIENELKMMNAVNDVASEFGVVILQPLLSEDFIKFAKTIPVSEKIKGKDDLIRKHIIRAVAIEVGVPEISANKRKKALQYGSQIHKALLKSR